MSKSLSEWGLDRARMQALKDKMELRVYTPGSSAGVPINLLGTFQRPASTDPTVRGELVAGTISGLLSLVGVEADPVRSPEHIVLSQILDLGWSNGEDLGLEALIVRLVDPPFKKVGVFPLDSFYPSDQRLKLAMLLNGVLASPSFQSWIQGEPLDPAAWTKTDGGKVPVSVFYLSHLSDPERMFFVSLLLERIQAWSRTLSGTNSLRALLYFDEVAGYVPTHPVNPPSKKPLLTLMKQARAVGLGVVLATQNPVDIDYKGLANAGTWMIGRMQTAQDRERVADGLISAAAGMDRSVMLQYFERLRPRVFMVKGPASDQPALLHTRQSMAFLRGPLTRLDLERLGQEKPAPVAPPAAIPQPSNDGLSSHQPPVPPGFANLFLDPRIVFSARLEGALEPFAEPHRPDEKVLLRPAIFAELQLRFDEEKGGFVLDKHLFRVFFPVARGLPKQALQLTLESDDLMSEAPSDALYEQLPVVLDEAAELKAAQTALVDEVFRNVTRSQFVHATLKLYSGGEENREQFQGRVEQAVQDRIDQQVAKLHERYDRDVASLQDKIARQESRVSQKQSEVSGRQTEQLWNAGETILSFFTGRKRSLSTALSKNRMTGQAQQRAEAAGTELGALQDKLDQLQEKLASETGGIEQKERGFLSGIEERPVRLAKSDVRVVRFGVLWIPVTRRV